MVLMRTTLSRARRWAAGAKNHRLTIAAGAMPITGATWNVNGIRARQEQFLEWVGRDRPDVICLQEIKASTAQLPEAVCSLDDYWCYWHGAGGYAGVSLNLGRDAF